LALAALTDHFYRFFVHRWSALRYMFSDCGPVR
jgi:hypothetical protein